jgi:hypothetical protein
MMERQYTLVEIIRDPRMLVCEASEMTRDGHYYLYRYNGTEGKFYRATVPSGAASTHFQVLETNGTFGCSIHTLSGSRDDRQNSAGWVACGRKR